MDFRRVDGIAAVMAFTVRDMVDEAFRFAQFFANQFDDVDISHFIMAADIIDFADMALLEDEVDGPAMVFDIEPVADIKAVPIDRQRLVMQGIDDHEGNQLFRKMIRTIVIRAAADGPAGHKSDDKPEPGGQPKPWRNYTDWTCGSASFP